MEDVSVIEEEVELMNVFYLEVVVGNWNVIKLLEEFVRMCLYLLWA